jgi:diguanylate cyclase (GGDEF)-like protein
MLKRQLVFVDALPQSTVLALAVLLTIVLGLLDYLTGYEVSFALFYLLPVSLAAWRLGALAGVAVSIMDALTWHFANALAGQATSNFLIPYWNTLTRLSFFFIVTALLAQLRMLLEEERSVARTDSLTGALNGGAFREAASVELARAARHNRPLSVLYIDLDNFKTVNDTFGHSIGDRLLCEVVRVIRNDLRPTDLVARLGGDEFCLLLPETDAQESARVIFRIQAALRVEMERNQWPVTLSIGVLTCLKPFPTADKLIHVVDDLMYRAKKAGRDAVEYGTYCGEEPPDETLSGSVT